ncbi:hypothetical protein PSTG_08513 [Puccinia striiformis f. sp. tritici PST-78]|uniref:HAT C-terminal dimerisation domain-containing protein n=1 Tax=Puccinia striiformis f. sp. tritici PST-78 TaxID=1165861 RepID=A0A0L0VG63_9BASI|nr:hypothetical protein PSTG_08513 [Puccinia striiformis f. sp. tritici PST-78]
MAQITNLLDEIPPSTPPDTTNVSTGPPQSVRRESTRLQIPTTRPGFVPTQSAPRRALVPASPAPTTSQSRPLQSNSRISVINSADEDDEPKDSQSSNMDCAWVPFTGIKQPESPPDKDLPSNSNEDDDSNSNSCGEEFYFYPKENEVVDNNTELERYNSGVFPMDKKGCVLGWWKVHCKDFPTLGSLVRDYLACAASSVCVERTSSAAAKVCEPGRSLLAIRTIERCISSHMWVRNDVRLEGMFSDCQAVIDSARSNPKFDKYKPKPQSKSSKRKKK